MSNEALVRAVIENLESGRAIWKDEMEPNPYDADFVSSLVSDHQSQYPGEWQGWNLEKKTKKIAAIVRRAAAKSETSVGRVMLFCLK